MELIMEAVQTTLRSFDFSFCIVTNILTYFIILLITEKNGRKDLSVKSKRIILIISILLMATIYWLIGCEMRLVINSAILTPVFWTWVMKPIFKKFGLDYKQINVFK